jgi:hypothetical protein
MECELQSASTRFGSGLVCNDGGASVRASRLVSSLAPPKLTHYRSHKRVEFSRAREYPPPVRWQRVTALIVLTFVFCANAESAKVIKVLPQFLDLKGRNSVNPSLFDRDAYQNELRGSPSKRSALRFDVQWKAAYYQYDALTLRIEGKGMKGKEPTNFTLEKSVKLGSIFSKWTALTLAGEKYQSFGELISWRATLVSGTNVVAEQKSFLW